MTFLHRRLVRLPLVAVSFMAWLSVSNHCAIAAVQSTAKMPMASCHGMSPAEHVPAKHKDTSTVECCKVLRATLSTSGANLVAYDALAFAAHDYVVGIIPHVVDAQTRRVIEWDTGPPGLGSFAESVLQRSILAHAPPVSLS